MATEMATSARRWRILAAITDIEAVGSAEAAQATTLDLGVCDRSNDRRSNTSRRASDPGWTDPRGGPSRGKYIRRLTLAAVSAALILVVVGCGGSGSSGSAASSGAGQRGGTLTLAPVVAPQPWDLKDAGLGNNAQYYQPVYDPLLRLDAKGNPVANLATAWKYDKTQTKLTLTLKSGVKFTDGTAFDAAAVKANLEHTKTGANAAAGQIKSIDSVQVVNPTTVTVTLTGPDPALVPSLANVGGMMASPKAIADGALKRGPVGTGPYTLDPSATTAGSQYTYVRNPNYWNAQAFPFDKIVLKPLTDPTAILNALRSGQINGALMTNVKNAAPAKAAGLTVNRITTGDVDGVFIWDRGGKMVPALGSVKVRQALNYAFDRDAILKTVKQGYGEPTTQVFNQATAAFDSSLDSNYSYDPARAKQLLAEAGYSNGFDVTVPDVSPANPDGQAAMEQQLKDIGVRVKLDKIPPTQLLDALLAGKYPMSWFSLGSFSPWDTISKQLQKNSPWNPLKYTDAKAQALIDKAQSTAPGPAQDALYKQLNDYTVEQAWNAPWTQVQAAYVTTKGIEVTPFVFAAVPPIYNFKPVG
jgi:peptide/nickel transport system substrate-binding protein